MKRTIVAIGLVTAFSAAHGAECQGPDGNWYDYGSPQCASGAVESGVFPGLEPVTAQHRSDDQRDPGELADDCMQYMKSAFNFKDRESLRVELYGALNLEVVDYANTRILAYKLPVWVNGKNSYGAYAGKTLYYCYLDQHSKKILDVEQIGKD